MAASLQVIPFTSDLLPKVQAFDCGGEPWELEVSNWIKRPSGEESAVAALAMGSAVWLYVNDADEIVGFGSLDKTEQRWPKAKDAKTLVSVIPWVAVDRRFWGQPPGPPEERYAGQILRDLVGKAMQTRDERPVLILYVHVNNARAIAFYERAGFRELHKPYTSRQTGWQYKRMFLVLNDPVS